MIIKCIYLIDFNVLNFMACPLPRAKIFQKVFKMKKENPSLEIGCQAFDINSCYFTSLAQILFP